MSISTSLVEGGTTIFVRFQLMSVSSGAWFGSVQCTVNVAMSSVPNVFGISSWSLMSASLISTGAHADRG